MEGEYGELWAKDSMQCAKSAYIIRLFINYSKPNLIL